MNGDSGYLERLPTRAVGAPAGLLTMVPVSEVAYAFTGAAAPPEALAALPEHLRGLNPRRVYIRTGRTVLWTPYRRVQDLAGALDPEGFLLIRSALLGNVGRIAAVDASGKMKLVAFVNAKGEKEWLTVSRRCLPALWERLALPPSAAFR